MLNQYKQAAQSIGLSSEDSEIVLSHILSEYRRMDCREHLGVDWIDLISEIIEEKKMAGKYRKG